MKALWLLTLPVALALLTLSFANALILIVGTVLVLAAMFVVAELLDEREEEDWGRWE